MPEAASVLTRVYWLLYHPHLRNGQITHQLLWVLGTAHLLLLLGVGGRHGGGGSRLYRNRCGQPADRSGDRLQSACRGPSQNQVKKRFLA